MSKPVLRDLFALAGRRNRQSYAACSLLLLAAATGSLVLVGGVAAALGEATGAVAVLAATPLWLALFVATWTVGAQRCRDFGLSGWAVLLTAVPVAGLLFGLAMFLVPGTPGPNRYGPVPDGPGTAPARDRAARHRMA